MLLCFIDVICLKRTSAYINTTAGSLHTVQKHQSGIHNCINTYNLSGKVVVVLQLVLHICVHALFVHFYTGSFPPYMNSLQNLLGCCFSSCPANRSFRPC